MTEPREPTDQLGIGATDMTDNTQPEALRLANEFKLCNEYDSIPSITDIAKAEAELRRHTNLLHYYICSKRPDPHKLPIFSVMQPSLIEELEARGYDITTLKFSIMKKVIPS